MLTAGITRFVAPEIPEDLKERWGPILEKTKDVFEEAGVEVVTY
jgi:hypothetical protein